MSTPPTAAERATAPGVADANRFALHPKTAECIHETAALLNVPADHVANAGPQLYAFLTGLVVKGWTITAADPAGKVHRIAWPHFDALTPTDNTEGKPDQP